MKLATLGYLRRDGKTLMLHRVKKTDDIHHGKWNGLGGKMESGETPEECLAREIREEAGLRITAPQLKGFLTFPGFSGDEDWYVFVFVVRQFSGKLIDSDEGHLRWIPDADLAQLEVWEGDLTFMKWLEQDRFFSGKFVYRQGVLQDHQVVFYE